MQSNGIHLPGNIAGGSFGGPTISYADISAAGGPGDQWDALPTAAKAQIIGAVGFLELLGEWAALKPGAGFLVMKSVLSLRFFLDD